MSVLFKAFLTSLSACFLSVYAFGQGNDYLVHFTTYTTEEGLSSNHVYNCTQDSRGIFWLVREGGIDRFDGEEFKHFTFPELKNITNMVFLLEDKEHDLWIRRQDKTIVFLNIFTEKLKTSLEKFGPTFPKNVDWAVQGIEDSYLLQDEASNIFRYRKGEAPVLYYATPGKAVSPLIEYDNGTAWSECNNNGVGGAMIATDRNGKEIIKIPYSTDHIYGKGPWGGDTIHYITKDSFYLASFKGIVLQKSLKSVFPDYVFSDPYINGRFQKIVVEQDRGLVWVYYPYQILVLDKSLRLLYAFDNKKHFVQSSNVYDMFVDNQNHTWICTFDGLHNVTFSLNPFHNYLSQDPGDMATYNPKSTRKVCKAADGNTYAIGSTQLFQILPDGGSKLVLDISESISAMEADEYGNLWFSNKLLYRYNVFTKKLSSFPYIAIGNWLMKIINHRIWFGYPLQSLDISDNTPKDERIYDKFDDLPRLDLYDIVQKNEREYYIATENGLYVLDTAKGVTAHYWEKGTGSFYLPVTNIRHIHIDKAGDFWMATTEGLLYWQPASGTFRLYNSADGVHANCNAVLEDDYGFLWIGSDYGLMKFDKKNKSVRTYLVTDGLPSDEFNRLSYFKDTQTGHLYLGGLNGLVKFHPKDFQSELKDLTSNTNLVLTECLLFSGKTNKEEDIRESVLQDNRITIHPGDLFLRIKFALTDFTKPSWIQYSYLIEGYNTNWHTGYENEILLSGLPYGNFTLKVKAITANGIPSEQELDIPIRVQPPFYLQTWFLVLLALLGALSVAWYIRRRTGILIERTAILEGMVSERTEVIENQRKNLKDLYDSKSRLYANITHEFRTPLTLIIGPARQALKSAETINHQGIRHNLSDILQNSEQLLGLVNQMLDLNKLESKALKPEYYQSDVIAFILQIVEKFQHYAESCGLSLSFFADREQLVMDFDAEFFEKVLNNLLSNAIKFTPSGGIIQVRAQCREQDLFIEVVDTGNGIEPEKLPFIFDRYYQADNSATRRSEGTGIGLALVKELVDLLEGSIRVASVPGRETVFSLVLPIKNQGPTKGEVSPMGHWETRYPAMSQPEQDTNEIDRETKPTVIVIEDNASVASFVASCLKEQYHVLTITDSRQGLSAVLEQLPDLVICDLMMPDLDGYQVCAAIKSDERSSHIPVMFLSAVTEQADRLKRLNAGADAYISKPFRGEELQTVATQLLHNRAHLRSKYLALAAVGAEPATENEPAHESLNPFDVAFLNKAKSAVLANLEESDFDGNELARILNFSNSQLHRKLSALTGLPAGRYIYQVRLEVARDLLRRKELSITEIAYQVGFSDPAYFTKMFTKEFGQSPSKYRTQGNISS